MSYNQLRKGRVSVIGQTYLITMVVHGRIPLFTDLTVGRCVVHALRAQDKAGRTQTMAFVVMPDHVHWLISLTGPRTLSAVVRQVKGMTAREINRSRQRSGPVWQASFHDHALRGDESVREAARYVIANPIRAGLVRSVRDYSLWDAAWV